MTRMRRWMEKRMGFIFTGSWQQKVPDYLTDGGWLIMEIGHDQSADVEKSAERGRF